MGFWQPVTNLKDYVSQKNPPAVTFFLCLLTLAISFIYLSFYSQAHTLPNPDIEKVNTHLAKVLQNVLGETFSLERGFRFLSIFIVLVCKGNFNTFVQVVTVSVYDIILTKLICKFFSRL